MLHIRLRWKLPIVAPAATASTSERWLAEWRSPGSTMSLDSSQRRSFRSVLDNSRDVPNGPDARSLSKGGPQARFGGLLH
jgi:hypothetical protein